MLFGGFSDMCENGKGMARHERADDAGRTNEISTTTSLLSHKWCSGNDGR